MNYVIDKKDRGNTMKQVLSTGVAVICVFVLAVTNGRTDGCKPGCSKGGDGKCICVYVKDN